MRQPANEAVQAALTGTRLGDAACCGDAMLMAALCLFRWQGTSSKVRTIPDRSVCPLLASHELLDLSVVLDVTQPLRPLTLSTVLAQLVVC